MLTVRFPRRLVHAYARTPGGPVLRDLDRRGRAGARGGAQVVRSKTRALVNSSRHEVRPARPSVFIGMGRGVRHAGYWFEGTRPHPIRPRRARALVFRVGGVLVITQRVRHPGTDQHRTRWVIAVLIAAGR